MGCSYSRLRYTFLLLTVYLAIAHLIHWSALWQTMGARAEQSVDTLACACVARDDRGSRQPDHVRRRFACHRGAVAAKRHGQLQGLDREAGVLISAHPTLHQSNAKDKLLAAATIGGVVAVGLPFLVERPRKASALHLFCEGGHR